MKRKPHRNPDRVYPEPGSPFLGGLGTEWRCPECGATFLVRNGEWGYVLNRRKYCNRKCLRAAEKKKSK